MELLLTLHIAIRRTRTHADLQRRADIEITFPPGFGTPA